MGRKLEAIWLKTGIVELMGNTGQFHKYNGKFLSFERVYHEKLKIIWTYDQSLSLQLFLILISPQFYSAFSLCNWFIHYFAFILLL